MLRSEIKLLNKRYQLFPRSRIFMGLYLVLYISVIIQYTELYTDDMHFKQLKALSKTVMHSECNFIVYVCILCIHKITMVNLNFMSYLNYNCLVWINILICRSKSLSSSSKSVFFIVIQLIRHFLLFFDLGNSSSSSIDRRNSSPSKCFRFRRRGNLCPSHICEFRFLFSVFTGSTEFRIQKQHHNKQILQYL